VRRELASGAMSAAPGVFTELPVVLREYPPDAIVLDLKMPGMSGKALGPFIRQYQLRPTR
jgi:CheY-like chemotaxis protein